MFYTKYRPQKFSEISKPNEVAESLMKQISTGKTAHAYLFVGPRGTGKTTTARILAKALNCLHIDKSGDPCNECEVCIAIQHGAFTDLIEIDAASNRGIDDIRDLREKVKLAPVSGKYKIYIVDEVHMLTTEAFNALLKTLEEPPKRVCFILCTTEFHKVPDTIKSRCQVFKFKRATLPQLIEKLGKIAKEEKGDLSKDQLRIIAKASLGGFRDAETLLQQVIEGSIEPESLTLMGSSDTFTSFYEALLNSDLKESLRILNKIYNDGLDLFVWVGEFISYLRVLLFVKAGAIDILDDEADSIVEIAQKHAQISNFSNIVYIIEVFMKAQADIKSSQIPQLPLEIAVLSVTHSSGSSSHLITVDPDRGGDTGISKFSGKSSIQSLDTDKHSTSALDKSIKPLAKLNILQVKKPESSSNQNNLAKDVAKETARPKIEAVDLSVLESKWSEIVSGVNKINSSIATLLQNSKISSSSSSGIELEVGYAFHRDRIESPRNKKIIEDVIQQVLGSPQYILCKVNTEKPRKSYSDKYEKDPKLTGNLTDYNIVAPASQPSPDFSGNILDIFDGGLPLTA